MEKKRVHIGHRIIGDGYSCFLVAEAGTTCNGNLTTAKELVDAAAESGFEAIKFQTIWPEQISDKSAVYRYETADGWEEENMYEMFKNLVFSPEQWQELAAYTRSKNLIFFSTVDYLEGIEIMDNCGVPVHKICSWDVTYEPLLKRIASTGKPVMLDLGPATLCDIARFVELSRKHGAGDVILLHDFHTDILGEMNMMNIPYLKKMFAVPVGFSSPGRNGDLDIIAVALGANVIEKRITLSRRSQGHHHVLCIEPHEFQGWIRKIEFAETVLGKEEICPSPADQSESNKYFRSICTTRPIKKREHYSLENLDGKRPGTGIPTRYLDIILGRKAARDLGKDTILTWEDIQ